MAGLVSPGPSWRTGLCVQAAVLKTLDESLALDRLRARRGTETVSCSGAGAVPDLLLALLRH